MKDGKGHGEKMLGVAGSLAVAAKSPNLPLAIEVANAFADVEIGNMWMAKTGIQTGIKTDPGKIDSPIKWYFDEFAKVNKTSKWVDLTAQQVKLLMKPGAVGDLRRHGQPGAAEPAHRPGRGPGQARGRAAQGQVGHAPAARRRGSPGRPGSGTSRSVPVARHP